MCLEEKKALVVGSPVIMRIANGWRTSWTIYYVKKVLPTQLVLSHSRFPDLRVRLLDLYRSTVEDVQGVRKENAKRNLCQRIIESCNTPDNLSLENVLLAAEALGLHKRTQEPPV
jgi:nitroreductase